MVESCYKENLFKMKCLILAGGMGERLWPLSRKNYPKQFIRLSGNHSVFQETVIRNMPFCDEFIILTSLAFKDIVIEQLGVFQGISYHLILEEIPRRTLVSCVIPMLSSTSSDLFLVTSSDIIIGDSEKYKDSIIRGGFQAKEGYISLFAKKEDKFNSRYGYITSLGEDNKILSYIEKPSNLEVDAYRNLGMFITSAGDFLYEVKKLASDFFDICKDIQRRLSLSEGNIVLSERELNRLPLYSVERTVWEHASRLKANISDFCWRKISTIEDLADDSEISGGLLVVNNSEETIAINNSSSRALVVDGIDDAVIVNTDDATYVGKRGFLASTDLKNLLNKTPELQPFFERSTTVYRQWGNYRILQSRENYHVREVTVHPMKTIFSHTHDTREENWTIVSGKARVKIGNKIMEISVRENINIPPNTEHMLSNISTEELIFIETSFGENLSFEERIPLDKSHRKGELDAGFEAEPLVTLAPVYKETLWGGRRLIEEFGFSPGFDRLAEAWVLSSNASGESIVSSGRHKGMKLNQYINTMGTDIVGWKCSLGNGFPLLVKFIDAEDDLSVQVHPGDDYALEKEGQYGKNEMWYVVDSKEGSGLYVGFKKDVSKEELFKALNDGTVLELMNFFPTKKGDCFFIPAGTVHSIGKGNLILEVQQSSTCTYRLYDFNRKDKYGLSRDLHIDKAMDVINLEKYENYDVEASSDTNIICMCKYFEVHLLDIEDEQETQFISENSRFTAFTVVEGSGTIEFLGSRASVTKGMTVFASALDGIVKLTGQMKVLACKV